MINNVRKEIPVPTKPKHISIRSGVFMNPKTVSHSAFTTSKSKEKMTT